MRRVLQAVVLALVCVAAPGRGVVAQGGGATFTNPLLEHGPDPWVIAQDGWYYYMNSMGKNITIWKTRDMTDLRDAGKTVVWTAPEKGPMSHDIWAPELHRFDGKWYLYFAADGGKNEGHRVYVLENEAADPTVGTWVMKGKVGDETNRWAIDATAFENDGPGGDHQKFLLWSGVGGSERRSAEYLHGAAEEPVDGGGAARDAESSGVPMGDGGRPAGAARECE